MQLILLINIKNDAIDFIGWHLKMMQLILLVNIKNYAILFLL